MGNSAPTQGGETVETPAHCVTNGEKRGTRALEQKKKFWAGGAE